MDTQKRKKICRVKVIGALPHQIYSQSLAVKETQSILIAGSDRRIKVWYFGGYLKLLRKKNEQWTFFTIIFSKKHFWFASSSSRYSIQGWKLLLNGEWECSQRLDNHQSLITGLILNKDENELISCSHDKSIIIWQVNSETNKIIYGYTLRLNKAITCISMNQSETYLISSDKELKIILWYKNKQNKWQYQNEILNDVYGQKMYFYSDYQFAWQQYSEGIIHMIEIQDLQVSDEQDNYSFFKPLYNEQKQIILQSLNKHIYFLQKQDDGRLQIVLDLIVGSNNCNYGLMTVNGEIIMLQDQYTCKIYKIQYH